MKLRKLAKWAKTVEERKEVEAGFRELGFELKGVIEGCADKDKFSDGDLVYGNI